jgi:hypothetical protein
VEVNAHDSTRKKWSFHSSGSAIRSFSGAEKSDEFQYREQSENAERLSSPTN